MSQHILILFWIGIAGLASRYIVVKQKETVEGVEVDRFHWLFAIILVLPLIIMAATRGNFVDTAGYRNEFLRSMPSVWSDLPSYIKTQTKDVGFSVLSALIKIIIGNNDILYFSIIAGVQIICVSCVYRKYSSNYILSVFLFVISTDYVAWTFNGIRQFLAVALIFAGTSLLLKKKYIPLILIILLASTIHQTALMMIPLIFIVQGKAWNKKTLLFISLVVIAVFFIGNFTTFLDNALSGTQYSAVVSDYQEMKDDGTNPFRVLVYSVPAIISFFGRSKIRESNSNLINICTNMSIITTGLYLVSMVTSGIFLGRLPIYVSLYNYMLLPWEIENLFEEKIRPVIYFLLVVLYLIFYIYQLHFTWVLF